MKTNDIGATVYKRNNSNKNYLFRAKIIFKSNKNLRMFLIKRYLLRQELE